jgi:protein gp37
VADNTAIEWADRTWNPLLGCERVSAGCDGCYAINTATIRAGNPHPRVAAAFAGLTERRDGRLDWTGRINLLPDRMDQPLGWRKPSKVFVNSQSDLFHKDVPLAFIEQVFAVMARTPQHTYQLLTKRHARMSSILRRPTFRDSVAAIVSADIEWPLPNLWLGVSVEDQHWADIRIPALLDTPAAVRWLSMEPLLGPVDLTKFFNWRPIGENLKFAPLPPSFAEACGLPALHWIVCGGESGPKARPIALQWARDLRDQSVAAGVPYFYKQWGEWVPPSQMPADTFMDWDVANGTGMYDRDQPWRMGKKRAGRLLDGRTWDEYPAGRVAVS